MLSSILLICSCLLWCHQSRRRRYRQHRYRRQLQHPIINTNIVVNINVIVSINVVVVDTIVVFDINVAGINTEVVVVNADVVVDADVVLVAATNNFCSTICRRPDFSNDSVSKNKSLAHRLDSAVKAEAQLLSREGQARPLHQLPLYTMSFRPPGDCPKKFCFTNMNLYRQIALKF